MRGVLTNEIQNHAVHLFGYSISQKELRLMPYLLDCSINNRPLERGKLDGAEMDILDMWKSQGYYDYRPGGAAPVIQKEFYEKLTALLYLAYVAYPVDDAEKIRRISLDESRYGNRAWE